MDAGLCIAGESSSSGGEGLERMHSLTDITVATLLVKELSPI